jgi:hypothetical protein
VLDKFRTSLFAHLHTVLAASVMNDAHAAAMKEIQNLLIITGSLYS